MTVYEVVTTYYDNGKVARAFHTYEMESKPENRCVEKPKFDRYHDYFTNKKEACKWYDDAGRA